MRTELILIWAAVCVYVAASIIAWIGLIWSRAKAVDASIYISAIGLVVHAVSIVLRWVRIDHGPYINASEVLSSSVWVGVLLFLGIASKRKDLRVLGGPALGISVLLMGWGILSNPEIESLPATFKSIWLAIHVLFAKLAYGSILVATGAGIVRIIRSYKTSSADPASLLSLEDTIYKLTGFGFVFITFMIVAGAIWAHEAWGRYWNWDPIETWALTTWVAYGLFLHARRTLRFKGNLFAASTIALLIISIVSFFVIAIVTPTIHKEFMVQ